MSKLEYARIIGLWLGVFILVIFTYQLGMIQMQNNIHFVQQYCTLNYSVGLDGSIGIWHIIGNITNTSIIP